MDTSDDYTRELTELVSTYDASLIDRRLGRTDPGPVVPQETLLAWVHAVTRWSAQTHTHLRRLPMPPDRVSAPPPPPQLAPAPLERCEALEQLRALWHGYRIAVHIAAQAPGPGVDTPEDLARVRTAFGADIPV